jgi:hypothetical protein
LKAIGPPRRETTTFSVASRSPFELESVGGCGSSAASAVVATSSAVSFRAMRALTLLACVGGRKARAGGHVLTDTRTNQNTSPVPVSRPLRTRLVRGTPLERPGQVRTVRSGLFGRFPKVIVYLSVILRLRKGAVPDQTT